MFPFLNVNRDQRGRHVHVDTGIIDCGNGGVRCFELSQRKYKNRNARKMRFSKVGDFYRWLQKQTVGRVSGNKTFFFCLIPVFEEVD